MKKKSHAAIAVALVTGGLAAKAQAGLFSTPVQNAGFEYDVVNNPNSLGYDYQLNQWYRVSGGEEWVAQSHIAVTNDSAGSLAYAMLMGGTGRGPSSPTNGQIYQQIGTYDPNIPISVNFKEAYLAGAVKGLTVSLFSGGSPSQTFTGYSGTYNTYGPTYSLTGATLLGSQTFLDSGTAKAFQINTAQINTGSTGTSGAPLWVSFTFNSTADYVDEVALDDIAVTAGPPTPILTWTGANPSAGWNNAASNWNSSSNTSASYNDSAGVIFDDSASNTIVNLNTSNVSPVSIVFNNASKTYTLQGSFGIAGSTGILKNGVGTVNLNTTNSFTGLVAVNAGVLAVQSAGGLGNSGGVSVANGATITIQGGASLTATPFDIAGSGASGQPGALVSVSGTNTIATLALDSDSTIAVNAGSLTITNSIGGSAALTKTGAGTLTLAASASYTGDTTVNGGTLVLTTGGSSGAIVSNTLNINGGTVTTTPAGGDALGYGGAGHQVYNINITNGGVFDDGANSNEGYSINWSLTGSSITSTGGGKININAADGFGFSIHASNLPSIISAPILMRTGTTAFNVEQGTVPNGIDLNVSGAISASSSTYGIEKDGSGTMALTGTSTFKGGVNVNGGTLMFGDGTIGHDAAIDPANTINNNAAVVFNTYAAQAFAGNVSGSGSVTVMGSGAVSLSGQVTSSGFFNVASGKVYINSNQSGASGISVLSGGVLGGKGTVSTPVTVSAGGGIEAGSGGTGQLTLAGSTTFTGSGAIDFGTASNYQSSTGVNFSGGVSVVGTTETINVASLGTLASGSTVKLITYSGTDPFSELTLGGLPSRAVGHLIDNTAANEIDLTVTGSDFLKWTGAGSLVWNTTNTNWALNSSGAAVSYINSPGDAVVFDDSAGSGKTTVTIGTTVNPNSVIFNNNSLPYTLTGTSGISGSTGITLNGTNTVTINTANSFTGPVTVNAGTLVIGNDSALGAAPTTQTNDLFLNGSTLQAAGALALNINRTVVVGSSGGTIDLNSQTISSIGSIAGTGPLVINNTGGGAGSITLGGSDALPTTTDTDTGTLTINGGTVVMGGSGISTYSSQKFASITVNSPAVLDVAGTHVFGYGGPPRPAIFINGGTVTNNLGHDNYLGALTMTAGTINGTGEFRLQNGGGFSDSYVTTLPASTSSVISVPSLALVTYGSDTAINFNISQGTVPSGVDLLISSTVDSTGMLMKTGAGTLKLTGSNTYSGGTNVSGGTLQFASAGAFPAFTPLTFTAGTAVAIAHTGSTKNNILANGLSFSGGTGAWTGTLDLNNNDMVVRGGTISTISNQIAQGYNNGGWNGTGGIISTTAATSPSHLTALGAVANDDGTNTNTPLVTSFDGVTVAEGDVLVKYTYYGDANLDGSVTSADYTRIDAGYLSNGSLTGWFNGDFNYDGVINGSDYTLIDNAFNMQGANIASQLASPTAQLAGGSSAVPEPASLGLLGLGAMGLLGRRRRRE